MVNLLSNTEQKKIRTLYRARLGATLLFLSAVILFAGGILLVPSYFLAHTVADAAAKDLQTSKESAASRAASGVEEKVAILSERAILLKEFERTPTATLLLSHIETDKPGEVGVNAISVDFSLPQGGQVTVSGKAKTREALIQFGKNLQEDRAFQGAAVPVSDLASGSNIDFSIHFTFTAEQL